jgi:6-phosphogluconolactonase (cycloisomerase 2 family)
MHSKRLADTGGSATRGQPAGKVILSRLVVWWLFVLSILVGAECPQVGAMVAPGVNSLNDPWQVTVTPDGAHVYVASQNDDAVAVLSRDGGTGILTLVEAQFDGVGGVDGLREPHSVTVSPDGGHVYVAGRYDDAVAVFGRDAGTGALTFVEAHFDGVGGVDGLEGAYSVAVSPDGGHVYVAARSDVGAAVFSRDGGTGALTFVEVGSLYGGESVTVSPDGAHVYVAAHGAVAVFGRDAGTGALTYIESQFDGVGGVEGLRGATSVTMSPDGAHLYVAADQDDAVVLFSRDAGTGALTFVEAHFDDVSGVDGLHRATSVAVSPGGKHVYVTGYSDEAVAAFSRDAGTGALTFVQARFDSEAGVYGLRGPTSVTVSPDGAHAYVASRRDDVVTAFSRNDTTGELTFVEDQFGGDLLLSGRRLLIKNATPEDKERNKGTWKVKDKDIVFPGFPRPYFPNDPHCSYGGTASIRFFSDGSAGSLADTGEIPLPCQNWSSITGGYRYKDRELDDGPCKSVMVRGGNSLKARCVGRGATTDFLYDLTEGTDEGIVNVVLSIGLYRYCTAFDDFNGRDGSDGRRFLGKGSSPPASCPVPVGSPAAAFLNVASGALE